MSTSPDHPDSRDLDRRKAIAELRKAEADARWFNRNASLVVGLAVSLGTLFISAAQVIIARGKDATELELRRIETGVELGKFIMEHEQLLSGGDTQRIARFIRVLSQTLPAEQSARLVAAVAVSGATTAESITAVQQVASTLSAPGQARVARALDSLAPAERPAASAHAPAAGSAGSGTAGAGGGRPLGVYMHFSGGAEDRPRAAQLARAMPADFPLLGIQHIPNARLARDDAGEVRFYRTEQHQRAEALARALQDASSAALGRAVPFTAIDISPYYPNLPDGRIEVWLPDF